MQPPSVEESKLIRYCLGSREPYDRVWCNGKDVAAASDQLMCVIDDAGSWQGGVLGSPFTDFLRLAGDEGRTESTEDKVKLSRGSVTLTLPVSPLKGFAWPRAGMKTGVLTLPQESVEEMRTVVSANGETGLQVTRFEMLGFAISKGSGYSLSLEALIKSKRSFDPALLLLLPSAFLTALSSAIHHYKVASVEVLFNNRMVWAKVGRTLIGAAVPEIDKWLELERVIEPLKDAAMVDVDLSHLEKDLALLQSLSRTISLSKAGVRCGAAHAWYEAADTVNLPDDCSLSTERLAAILPLAPKLKRVASRVVELEGEHFMAYLATAGL